MSFWHFIPPENISGENFTAPQRAARHIAQSLRLRAGETVGVFDGGGARWHARLDAVDRDFVSGVLLEKLPALPAPPFKTVLCFAPVSRQAVEQILDQCTQLGCSAFMPVKTARTQFDITPRWTEKTDRLREILINSCEQCGSPFIPELLSPRTFVSALKENRPAVIASPGGKPAAEIVAAAKSANPSFEKLYVFVGPEGGFTNEENAAAKAAGVLEIGLGKLVLRAETACAAACFALSNL
jgi:16S rRNA (uracil1498-N3)-methyltransferase